VKKKLINIFWKKNDQFLVKKHHSCSYVFWHKKLQPSKALILIFFNSISFLLKNGVAKTSSWNGNLIRKLFTQSTIYSQFLIQFLPRRVFFCECEKGNLKRSNGQLLLLLVFVGKLFCLNLFLRLKIHFW
jgi:hypothetical protein